MPSLTYVLYMHELYGGAFGNDAFDTLYLTAIHLRRDHD